MKFKFSVSIFNFQFMSFTSQFSCKIIVNIKFASNFRFSPFSPKYTLTHCKVYSGESGENGEISPFSPFSPLYISPDILAPSSYEICDGFIKFP